VGPRSHLWETGAAQVAVSASGHLAYALGGVFAERRHLFSAKVGDYRPPTGPERFVCVLR